MRPIATPVAPDKSEGVALMSVSPGIGLKNQPEPCTTLVDNGLDVVYTLSS